MKKYIIGLYACLLSVMFVMPAFAQENAGMASQGADGSVLLTDGSRESTGSTREVRGSYISTGTLRISNPGKGQIGVYMQTLAHVPVDRMLMNVYVDRWIESDQGWSQVADYSFEFTKEDNQGQGLTMKSVSFRITGQPANCYYRLRGSHMVFLGSSYESLGSRTDGILITK